jgi:cytochrome P450
VVADPNLIPKALEEAGRLEAPVQFLGRKSTRDVTLHGVTIPANSNVLMMLGAANRDERVYQNPDVFDVHRVMAKPPITWGFGPHTCLGIHLARLEAQIGLTEILTRWPDLKIDESGLVRVRGFHVFGWQNVPVSVARVAEAVAN